MSKGKRNTLALKQISPEFLKSLVQKLDNIEEQLASLHSLITRHQDTHTSLLVGWDPICTYMRRGRRTLQKYRRTSGFPAIRVGRNVFSSGGLIDAWLLSIQTLRAQFQEKQGDDRHLRLRRKDGS